MKRIFTFFSSLLCVASGVFGQITIDGNLNEAGYTTVAMRGVTSLGFGPDVNAKAIKIAQSAGAVYIGVTGFLDASSNDGNAIGLMLNFTSTSHPSAVAGAAAGTNLKIATTSTIPNYMYYNIKVGFEVDYMFALNPGGMSATNCFVNGGKKIGGSSESYLGNIEQLGFETADVGVTGGFFASAGVNMAFKRDLANSNAGFEMKIPFSALGLPNNAQLSVQAFAFVVSPTGYFSNITVPGTPTPNNLGQDGTGAFVSNDAALSPTIDFSTLAGGPYVSSSVVIPVEMTNFDATTVNNTVKLNWLTASERNNAYFDVERSANGRDWSKIGQVKGSGTSTKTTKYTFSDETPLPTINYYRLNQVDNDGKSSYSPTVSVNIKGKGKQFSVFPNPAQDRLNVVSDRFDTEGSVEFYDLSGRLVKTVRSNTTQLDISNLASGLYQVRLLDKTGAVVNQVRFVKD